MAPDGLVSHLHFCRFSAIHPDIEPEGDGRNRIDGSRSNGLSLDGFMRFVKVMQMDIAEFWKLSPAEQRIGVQNLLFKNGLHYVSRSKEFEHPKSCLFGVLAGLSVQKGGLASPTGFEPVLPP
jgi:hypothetical protein